MVAACQLLFTAALAGQPSAQLLWDSYGVPHIFAKNNESVFRAFGYAQMESHGDLILRLYGQARGRAAEYWGERYLESDRWVWTNAIPERATEWYKAQSPTFRRCLDAFAAGINEYGREHGARLASDVRIVLPVTGADVLAHGERVILFTFVTSPERVQAEVRQVAARPVAASNAWAIAPKRTADGHAMLLCNPHLPWQDLYTFYEAHLNAPGLDVYGTTLVGSPQISIGFNKYLGWSHTVNTIDAADVYELVPAGSGYRFDGTVKPFEVSHHTIKVKMPDGGFRDTELTVRRSVQGPVVAERDGRLFALRVAGLDAPGAAEEWWDMGRARNIKEFENALRRLQIPMFNVMYADRDGHILYVFNGTVPMRPKGDWSFWSKVVPGDNSATLWTKVHRYEDLPRVADPNTGWLQNANDPPWTCTYPPALDAAKFPAYMAPQMMGFRPQRSTRMLREEGAFTLDKLVAAKHSTRSELADRMLDVLIDASRKSNDEKAQRAAEVLSKWDRSFDAGSRGAVLFHEFALRWLGGANASRAFAVPWSAADPLETPKGIEDPTHTVSLLTEAEADTEKRYHDAAVAWGDVNRFESGDVNLPGNGDTGNLGVFRVINYGPARAEHPHAMGGDSFVAAVEFSNPVQARVLIGYGNSSQPGSRHRTDQLPLLEHKRLRQAWLTREEVERHLESRENLQ